MRTLEDAEDFLEGRKRGLIYRGSIVVKSEEDEVLPAGYWDNVRRNNPGGRLSGGWYRSNSVNQVFPSRCSGIYAIRVDSRSVKFGCSSDLSKRLHRHLKVLSSYGVVPVDWEFRNCEYPREEERDLFERVRSTRAFKTSQHISRETIWCDDWRLARQVLFDREDVQ